MDLKDTYFHIHIVPHNRPFLRFPFEGVAYQYVVLPLTCFKQMYVWTDLQKEGSYNGHLQGWGTLLEGNLAFGSWSGLVAIPAYQLP